MHCAVAVGLVVSFEYSSKFSGENIILKSKHEYAKLYHMNVKKFKQITLLKNSCKSTIIILVNYSDYTLKYTVAHR